MKKIFSICILGMFGMIFLIAPTVFASSDISPISSQEKMETIKNSIIIPLKAVGSMYSSLISYTFYFYREGGAAAFLSIKNNLKGPSLVPLPDDEVTIIIGPTVESK